VKNREKKRGEEREKERHQIKCIPCVEVERWMGGWVAGWLAGWMLQPLYPAARAHAAR